jgi:hypothetical protein
MPGRLSFGQVKGMAQRAEQFGKRNSPHVSTTAGREAGHARLRFQWRCDSETKFVSDIAQQSVNGAMFGAPMDSR